MPFTTNRTPWLSLPLVSLCVILSLAAAPQQEPAQQPEATAPEQAPHEDKAALGALLFREQLFTNPALDYEASCSGCHKTGEEIEGRTQRRFTDYTALSLRPDKTTTTRNTPALIDLDQEQLYGRVGSHSSLEDLIEAKLLGPDNGWKSSDQQRAAEAIQFTLLEEASYKERFKAAYSIDLESGSSLETVKHAASVLADYARAQSSTNTARWDAFAEQNRLRTAPTSGQSAFDYSFTIESRIGNQEGRQLIRRPEGFTREAYEGFKVFFRMYGEEGQSVGNCIACHTPPHFTDFKFHNTGVSEMEYDLLHGDGSFAKLAPGEPTQSTSARPHKDYPDRRDLGRFNHAPTEDGAFAAFKTPSLRNVSHTDPYLHTGAAASLEEVVHQKLVAGELARAGKLTHIDEEIAKIQITEDDVARIAAFLRQLDEVGTEQFRYYLIHFED